MNSTWGAHPKTLRMTTLALSHSTAGYASPVRARSCHAKKIDPEVNNACRIVTGQLRPTQLPLLYRTAGIAPPQTWREMQARTHKHSQENNKRHLMFDHKYPRSRLKSRKCFRTVESLDPNLSAFWCLKAWNELETYPNEAIQLQIEELPTGTDLQRKDWVSLNRARAKVGRMASTLHKWKLTTSSEITCGHPNQTVNHILSECPQGSHYTDEALRECNEIAQVWITHWRDKI